VLVPPSRLPARRSVDALSASRIVRVGGASHSVLTLVSLDTFFNPKDHELGQDLVKI